MNAADFGANTFGNLGIAAAALGVLAAIVAVVRILLPKRQAPLQTVLNVDQFLLQSPGTRFRISGRVSAKTARQEEGVVMSLIEQYQGVDRSWRTRGGIQFKGLVVAIEGGEVPLASDRFALSLELPPEQSSERSNSINGIEHAQVTTIWNGQTYTATWDGERGIGTVRRLYVSVGDSIEVEGSRPVGEERTVIEATRVIVHPKWDWPYEQAAD